MGRTILRGRTFGFLRAPESLDDAASHVYRSDGAIVIEDGRIVESCDFSAAVVLNEDVVIDHHPHLILPGFIDAHAHFPQMQVIGSYGAELLDWLNTYTFPAELKFADAAHAARIASAFLDEMVRHGTTTASVYCTVHAQSADALFAAAEARGMAMIAGKVMMDRNAPSGLCDTAEASYHDTKALIGRWHGKGRARYAITPRFAITSTPAQLEAAGALAAEFLDCHVQTHLSENHAEIDFTNSLYPGCGDYAGIYEQYGLTGPKSLFGHCIHLSDREADALSDSGSVAVFCPTSNLFLGSGHFDYQRYRRRAKPLRMGIATDVGGGTNYSMLRTLDEGYKVIAFNGEKLDPLRAFWQVTLGNAEALSMESEIGALKPGLTADIVVLDAAATPAMRLRMETVSTLTEELFLLQTLGDDRAVIETYVAGTPQKSRLSG